MRYGSAALHPPLRSGVAARPLPTSSRNRTKAMARKKNNDGDAIVVGVLLLVAFLFLLATPLILLITYLYNVMKTEDIRKNLKGTVSDFWLSSSEKRDFKQTYGDASKTRRLIDQANTKGDQTGISRNKDGTFSARSKLGKELKAFINHHEPILDRLEDALHTLETLPGTRWDRYNNYLRNANSSLLALCVWTGLLLYHAITEPGRSILQVFRPYWAVATNFFRSEAGQLPLTDADLKWLAIATVTCIASWFLFRLVLDAPAASHTPKPPAVTMGNVDGY